VTRYFFGLTLLCLIALGGFLLPQAPDQGRQPHRTPLPYPTHVYTTPIVFPSPPPPITATQVPTVRPTPAPVMTPSATARPSSKPRLAPTSRPVPTVLGESAEVTPMSTPTIVLPKYLPRTGEALE
jgi:hypothetical protein